MEDATAPPSSVLRWIHGPALAGLAREVPQYIWFKAACKGKNDEGLTAHGG